MKRTAWACVCLFTFLGTTAFANPTAITVLSETHHLMGNADAGLPDDSPYFLSGAEPISASVSVSPDGRPYSYSSAGNFSVSAEAGGTEMWSFGAAAQSTYRFTANAPNLRVTFAGEGLTGHGGFEAGSSFSLYDLTAGFELDSYEWIPDSRDNPAGECNPSFTIDYSNAFILDPAHIYRLDLRAFAGGGEGGEYSSELTVDFTNPAPGALLLGGIGAAIVGWMRRRKQV